MAWLALGAIWFLSGCVSPGNRDSRVARFAAYGVEEPILVKIARWRPLELEEIVQVSKREVPASLLIEYLGQTRAVYKLASADVSLLQERGVAPEVIDTLLSSPSAALDRERQKRPPAGLFFRPYIGPYWGPMAWDPYYGMYPFW